MKQSRLRAVLAASTVAALSAALLSAGPTSAAPDDTPAPTVASASTADKPNAKPKKKHKVAVRVLSFNDFHGRLESDEGLGGAPALAAKVKELRSKFGKHRSITAAAGDLIGASQFASTIFQDEPTIEVMEALGLQTSAVGNHEFDEGVRELLRIQHGGCFDECFDEGAYDGADFPYLAANVVWKGSGKPILPPYWVKKIRGVEVGFIGVVTSDLPVLVNPSGIRNVDVLDEAETINRYSRELAQQGVKAQVVLMHEGSQQTWTPAEGETEEDDPRTANTCIGLTGPVGGINDAVSPQVDAMITGHSHDGYVCDLEDGRGRTRTVTQASDYGTLVTATKLVLNKRSGNVVRDRSKARNHEVTEEDGTDAAVQAIVDKWLAKAAPLANRVVGSVTEDITGDSNGDRGAETPMGRLVADSILWGTQADNAGGAEIAFMNTSGVRDEFLVEEISGGEQPGEITYGEAGAVAPFGNLLVTLDLTGADIEAVLNQQFKGATASRPVLALNPSEGFTYEWDAATNSVVPGSMMLNGEPIVPTDTYRVATLNFLADGGDGFTAFTNGTNVLGGASDLENLVAYLEANPGLSVTEDRVGGL